MSTQEESRLLACQEGKALWRKWGPYLSERQWGTVREDYSGNGDPWNYLSYEQACSFAYRWGEDGIAGICDQEQILCFAPAFWNEKDPLLKERLFGLIPQEGNHGEDVKEYYFYLDNLPSHAYMRYLYKYPQLAYPYEQLRRENRSRDRTQPEYELIDTGIFEEDRYFDIMICYAKASEEDLLIEIEAFNRGPDTAPLHLLPTLWFRNTWRHSSKPSLSLQSPSAIHTRHSHLPAYMLYAETIDQWLFTDNETHTQKLYGSPNPTPYVKDAFHEYLIHQKQEALHSFEGTKVAAYVKREVPARQSVRIRLRLTKDSSTNPFSDFDQILQKRKQEADAFYQAINPFEIPEDMRQVQRQAFAGLLWNKQFYHYNVREWLDGDQISPPQSRKKGRNSQWKTLDAKDIFSMPDKWEYPWFAAWDLAFHTISLSLIDPDFAKQQLLLLMKEWYMHPNGQIPAYEWDFGDVNPPVHAWAALRIYRIEQKMKGKSDRNFLEQIFQKLLINFTWWVNRKDQGDRNLFEGGFLGLDNIGPFDRSKDLPNGSLLSQVDGTGWMGMYCLNLLQMALELAIENPNYEEMATKFFEHFVSIARAINNLDEVKGLWDAKEGFYFGVLSLPDGQQIPLSAITLLGVIPLFAVETSEPSHSFPKYRERFQWFLDHHPELMKKIIYEEKKSASDRILLSLASPEKLECILKKVLDEQQLLSPFGIRSVSKNLSLHPLSLQLDNKQFVLNYEPAESTVPLFGGNSNWRGPIWFPLNYLLIEALQRFDFYLEDRFRIEHPQGSKHFASLWEVSRDLSYRLIRIFLKDETGKRPLFGPVEKFQTDPHFRDYLRFPEYFHGDFGWGLGASQQTGWTGLIAKLIQQYGEYNQQKPRRELEKEKLGDL